MPNRIEKATSEVMGAAKAAKATVERLTGVFQLLAREHGQATALLIRVNLTSNPHARRELFPTIRERLLAHERGELAAIYPVFRQHGGELAAFAEMHEREAGALERILQRLSHMPYDDPQWAPVFDDLTRTMQRHAKEEEEEYFPVASRILGEEATEAMETRYLVAKSAAANGS